MSSTPEEGEDGAQEDAIDFPDEAPEVGETTNGSEWGNQQGSTATGAIDDPEDAPVVDGREEIELEQDQDDDSLVNTEGAVGLRRNVEGYLRSDEDNISIPDDSPSVQV